ncbi:Crp/Fnr family transcriptional regulator [Pedobacter insulae]|uniref:CRP/FNR family transcriptional regulator, anaerobic regulatory protein n=1 Tax=Pedobacter insulae TaxID=414048 RepID=A0A1I2WI72_9SPHI|nr:Crp/Fnr family transcriptional regulator [Pedobacter insulae]SFH00924.1 CRP/FNR family transcriptional regulator, anaerobic regulatory protein [Pedobacter insulae]
MDTKEPKHLNCFLCKHSLSEWQDMITNRATIHQFKKGQQIFSEGEQAQGFYFLHNGKVKVHKQWGPDKDLIIKIAKEGEVLGHRGIGTNEEYPVSATALENTEVCLISASFLKTTLKVNPQLTYELMLYYANELREAELNMRDLVHMDVRGRIAKVLSKLEEIFGVDEKGYIESTMSRQDISSFAGTTYETVFKVLNEFNHKQFIVLADKKIMIKNRRALIGNSIK